MSQGHHLELARILLDLGLIPRGAAVLREVDVCHDSGCPIFFGGLCKCDCDIVCVAPGRVRVWKYSEVCSAL